MALMRGYVQVYTGDGKGKTTAAIGLAVRAVGAGLRVFFGQFIKCAACGELKALRERFPEIRVEQYGRGFVRGRPTREDIAAAQAGLVELREAMLGGQFDVVIADEAHGAASTGLVQVDDLLGLIDSKPQSVELVLTGRGADPRVIERADLVTEMNAVKHYFDKGVKGRVGIER